jgi:dihydrodipicolinate synthase/N-acetylneuraminate lyase
MYLAVWHGQLAAAQRLASPIAQVTAALFRETSPAPLKYALSLFALMSPNVRLPLVELGLENRAPLATAMAQVCDEHEGSMIGVLHSPQPPSCIGGLPKGVRTRDMQGS